MIDSNCMTCHKRRQPQLAHDDLISLSPEKLSELIKLVKDRTSPLAKSEGRSMPPEGLGPDEDPADIIDYLKSLKKPKKKTISLSN